MKTAILSKPGIAALVPGWERIRKSTPFFGPIRNEHDYSRMKSIMEQLLEVVGDNEDHDLIDLLDVTSTLIEQYEAQVQPAIPPVEPAEVLKFLMKEHGLKQTDFRSEIGSQGVVSEILAGKRQLNVRQAKELAKRFKVSTAAFV